MRSALDMYMESALASRHGRNDQLNDFGERNFQGGVRERSYSTAVDAPSIPLSTHKRKTSFQFGNQVYPAFSSFFFN